MSLSTNVSNLATRIATEVKALRTLINGNAADLSSLTTTAKGNLVVAINEVAASVGSAAGIDDEATFNELAAALGDDPNFATTVSTALGNRVRTDTAAQGLDSTQQGNARTNIAAASAATLSALATAVGDTEVNYVTTFESGLV